MASDDNSGARPAGPVVLRIKLRYDDVATMVARFAPNVGKAGLFLPTKSIQPIGTEVKFELRLSNDTPVLVGLGKVKHVRPPDPNNPKAAFGIAIELVRVSREGREVIIKMIERRRAMGLPDVAVPVPEDGETARRNEGDSQARADGGVVREAMKQFASEPVAVQVTRQTGPLAVVSDPQLIPIASQDSQANAAPSRPIVVEPSKPVPALAPEPPKTKRPRFADLVAKATELSGPLASMPLPALEEHVDVEHALVRARALAGSDLDAELAALRDAGAAPIEIGIETASAELARQLGGVAIARRERSAGWAPPPAIETRREAKAADEDDARTPAPVEEDFEKEPVPATGFDAGLISEPAIRAFDSQNIVDENPVSGAEQSAASEAYEIRPLRPSLHDVNDSVGVVAAPQPLLVSEDADAEALERMLEGERSQTIGAVPIDPDAFSGVGPATNPDVFSGLGPSTNAEASALGLERPVDPDPADDEDEDIPEISDLDVLAVADEDDAEPITSHGQREVSDRVEAVAPEPLRPSDDFSARLALGEEPAHQLPAAGGDEPHVPQTETQTKTVTPQRPLPGLPLERRPERAQTPRPTGLAHTVRRASPPTTPPPTPPVAFRKPPTQPVPVAHKRASTEEDGVLIDFDDDD